MLLLHYHHYIVTFSFLNGSLVDYRIQNRKSFSLRILKSLIILLVFNVVLAVQYHLYSRARVCVCYLVFSSLEVLGPSICP